MVKSRTTLQKLRRPMSGDMANSATVQLDVIVNSVEIHAELETVRLSLVHGPHSDPWSGPIG